MSRVPAANAAYGVHYVQGWRVEAETPQDFVDPVAVERPLELRVNGTLVASTLRTPGHDRHWALGLLASLLGVPLARQLRYVSTVLATSSQQAVDSVEFTHPDIERVAQIFSGRLAAQFQQNSACGACGLSDLAEQVRGLQRINSPSPRLCAAQVLTLVQELSRHQTLYSETGGLHAAAIASEHGIQSLFEDVGRHNAVDKAIGHWLESRSQPFNETILLVTSRAGYEIVHKACAAGIPWLICMSAATSLAVEVANQCQLTLVAFARDSRFNVYSGAHRLEFSPGAPSLGEAKG
jgi:FdhD protein